METRDLGVTLDATAISQKDSSRIDLSMRLKYVRPLEVKKWPVPADPNGFTGQIARHYFTSLSYTGRCTMQSGERILAAIFTSDRPAPAVELLLVRATQPSLHP
jgi:hypothetical protein